MFARALNQLGAQIGVAADGDGELHVVQFEQTVNSLARLFLAGIDEIKHAARFASNRQRQFGWRIRKDRVDWKAERLDLFRRHIAFAKHFGGGFVGDAEKIARRPEPRGIDADGIGDDGDEAERALMMVLIDFFYDVRINRIGGDDAVGLGFGQDSSVFCRRVKPPSCFSTSGFSSRE